MATTTAEPLSLPAPPKTGGGATAVPLVALAGLVAAAVFGSIIPVVAAAAAVVTLTVTRVGSLR